MDINNLLWTWLKSMTEKELLDNRKKLDKELFKEDRDYMVSFYGPREHQFIRAYTRRYSNLGCNSTQRGESYHSVIKSFLNPQIALSESVRRLRDHIDGIGLEHDRVINKERNLAPRLLDPMGFSVLKTRITHYALVKSEDVT